MKNKNYLLIFAGITVVLILSYIIVPNRTIENINDFFNRMKPLDKSCKTNEDCVMKQVDCGICDYGSKGDAVNKNYKPFCPLPHFRMQACPEAMPDWWGRKAVCENGACVVKSLKR